MNTVKKLPEEFGQQGESEGLAYLTTVPVKDIRLTMPTAYPVAADFQCILGIGKRNYEFNEMAVLVPDGLDGYFLIGNVHVFNEAIQTDWPKLSAIVVNIALEWIPAFRRVLNREALPPKEYFQTMFKLIDFYDLSGPGSSVRNDDGSQIALYEFLAALLNEDVKKISQAYAIHWLGRHDLKEWLYEGEIDIQSAYNIADKDWEDQIAKEDGED